jgi:hypothetical protein
MVSAWWLMLAFLLGGSAGMLVMAIMALAKDLPKKEMLRAPALRGHLP